MSDGQQEQPLWRCFQFVRIRQDNAGGGSYWPCLVFSNSQELLHHQRTNPIIPPERQQEFQFAMLQELLNPVGSGRVAVVLGPPTGTPTLLWELATAPLPLRSLVDFFLTVEQPIPDDLKAALSRAASHNGNPSGPMALPLAPVLSAAQERVDIGVAAAASDDDGRKMPAKATVRLPAPTQTVAVATAPVILPHATARAAVPRSTEATTAVQLPNVTVNATLPAATKIPPFAVTTGPPTKAAQGTTATPQESQEADSLHMYTGAAEDKMAVDNVVAAKTTPVKTPKKGKQKRIAQTSTPQARPQKTPKTISSKKAPPPVEPQLCGTNIEFDDVKAIFEKGGYKFGRVFKLPHKRGSFKTQEEFRKHLRQEYVPCQCDGTKDWRSSQTGTCTCWYEEDLQKLHFYTRYEILHDSDFRSQVPEPRLLTGTELDGLLRRIGVDVKNSRYKFPGEHTEVGWVGVELLDRPLELKDQVARFQWPACCDFSKISEEERFNLEFTIVQESRVETFVERQVVLSRKERRSSSGSSAPTPKSSSKPVRVTTLTAPKSAKKPKPKTKVVKRAKPTKKPKSRGIADDATVISYASDYTSSTRAKQQNDDEEVYPSSAQQSPVSHHSPPPFRHSTVASISPGPSASRISIGPQDFASSLRPVYSGTDCEKLRSCLDALSISKNSDSPTFCASETSQFKTNMEKIHGFLQTTVVGKTSDEPFAQSSAIYVCGVPGIGKTSGVRWCCNLIQNANDQLDVVVCEINAASLVSHSNPLENLYDTMGASLRLKSRKAAAFVRKLHHHEDKWNNKFLIVVVDEIESLVASEKLRGALRSLSELSNKPHVQMALIGISNSMNDDKYELIRDNCQFQETITFRAYSESEILDILYARVGDGMICKPAIGFIAKKVSEGGGGDARKALEMAAYAVQLRLDQTEEDAVSSGALVTFRDAMNASKASEGMQIGERVASLPPTGLAVLCVLVEFASAGIQKTTIMDARSRANECLREARQSDDILPGPDFMLTLEMIVDMGLLGASRGDKPSEINFTSRDVSAVMQEEIYLQTPLEEVSKILDTEVKLPFFQTIRHQARVMAAEKKNQATN